MAQSQVRTLGTVLDKNFELLVVRRTLTTAAAPLAPTIRDVPSHRKPD